MLSQRQIGELFGKNVKTINEHINNIFSEGELERQATIRKFQIVQTEGNREVKRDMNYYNLNEDVMTKDREINYYDK